MNRVFPTILVGVGSFLIGGSLGLMLGEEEDTEDISLYEESDIVVDGVNERMEDAYAEFTKDYESQEDLEEEDEEEEYLMIERSEEYPNIVYARKYDKEKDEDWMIEGDKDGDSDLPYLNKPDVITVDSFENDFEEFSKETLTYYEEDGVLADDRDEVIVDYIDYVGENALDSFGEGSEDPNLVYVRNYDKEVDFEIVKDESSYQKEVLGYNDPYDRAKKYFNLDEDMEE